MEEKKYCSACQAFKSLEGGKMKQTRTGQRWVCLNCSHRSNVSQYARKKNSALPTM